MAHVQRKGEGRVRGSLLRAGVLVHSLKKRPQEKAVVIVVPDRILSKKRPNLVSSAAGTPGISDQGPQQPDGMSIVVGTLVIEGKKQETVFVHPVSAIGVAIKREEPPIFLPEI